MPVCSYVVFAETGRSADLARRLEGIPGCEVERAENRDLLLLVTDTATPEADHALRTRVEAEPGIQAMVMAFGEIDPETEQADPVAAARALERGGTPLPVLDPSVLPQGGAGGVGDRA